MKRTFCLCVQLMLSCVLLAQSLPGGNKIYYQTLNQGVGIASNTFTKHYRADANGDGINDIFLLSNHFYVLVFDAAGNYVTQEISFGSYSQPGAGSMVAADFNGDGRFDIAWFDYMSRDVIVAYWTGNGPNGAPIYGTPTRLYISTFSEIGSYVQVFGLNTADMDGDGDTDMIAFADNIVKPFMLLNNGGGTFASHDLDNEARNMSASVVTDWNGDGKLDIIAGAEGGIDLYTNNGTSVNSVVPSFTRSTLINADDAGNMSQNSFIIDLADFNNDGKSDLLVNFQTYVDANYDWVDKTRIFINTTTAAPAYSFQMTELPLLGRTGKLGGPGARIADLDSDGTLDIMGSRANNVWRSDGTDNKISWAKLSVDPSGHVTMTEKVIFDDSHYLNRQLGANVLYEDLDGDNEPDYIYSMYNGYNGPIIKRTTSFPTMTGNENWMSLNDNFYIGGNGDDEVTLTVSGAAGTVLTNMYQTATVSGDGTAKLTITGRVMDINENLHYLTVGFPDIDTFVLHFNVHNASTGKTYEKVMNFNLARIVYYPKPGRENNLYDINNWSTAKDGSGSTPSIFGPGSELVFSNANGTTSFAMNGYTGVSSHMVIPAGAELTVNGNLFIDGKVDNAGKIKGDGTITMTNSTQEQTIGGEISIGSFSVSNSFGVKMNGTLTVTNSIAIQHDSKLVLDKGTLVVKQGLGYQAASIDASAGTVLFAGTQPFDVYTDVFTGSIDTLKIDCYDRASIWGNNPLNVNTLHLTHGRLGVNGNLNFSVGTLNGGDEASYLTLEQGTYLRMKIGNGISTKFPIGYETNYGAAFYKPVTITNNSGAEDVFGINASPSWFYPMLNLPAVNTVWNINKTNPNGGDGIDLLFNWNSTQQPTVMYDTALYHFDGATSTWTKQTGTTIVEGTSLLYKGYKGGFSPFAIMGSNTALPLTWTSFKASTSGSTVVLDWATASEINTKDFVVERSTDGRVWQTIGTVVARSSANGGSYQFTDLRPASGQNLYRLHQRDQNGLGSFSKIVSVSFGQVVNTFSVYPNPVANGTMNIVLSQRAMVSVYNNTGMLVVRKQLEAGSNHVAVGGLPKGLYSVSTNNKVIQVLIQ